MKRRILFITAFLLYMAAVLYLCLAKPEDLPQTELYLFGIPLDKAAHFLMFLPFPILAYSTLWKRDRKAWTDIAILIIVLGIGVGLAFLTEHLQALTQYRSSDIKDIYADMAGLAAGSIIVLTNIIFKSGRSRKQTDNE
jgi:VanZ family protein